VRRCWSKNVAVDHDQAQSARIKEGVMVEVGPSSEENDLPAAQPQARHDFSSVQGFQVVDAERRSAPQAVSDQAWRDALRLELEARAARLHQAVDAGIVLSNDGIIRWLGDPVARLSPGADGLNPTAVILADESLPHASRETIDTRIGLWIAATTRRLLAPLFALDAMQGGSEVVRDLARGVVRSLGVLEREPIRAKIKALSQDDRAELRKLGVRFGAYYVFVPALIKPAPRTLALQLWGLQAPGDANELLRTLGPVASSGRTSLPLDKGISREGYRVAGYRLCGERVVRVDVVERLAGMIRGALGGEPTGPAPGRPSHRSSKGFVVSGEMTSLTGCSGEQFGSILRSMGFRSVEMKRSEFFAPPPDKEAATQGEPSKPTEEQGSPEGAQAPTGSEDEVLADSVLAALPSMPASDEVPSDPGATSEALGAIPEDGVLAADPEGDREAVAARADVDAVLQAADVGAGDEEHLSEGGDALSDGAGAAAEVGESAPVEMTAPPASDPFDNGSEEKGNAESVFPQTSGLLAEPAKNAEMIIVWRPDHRKTAPRRERETKHPRAEAPPRSEAQAGPQVATPNWRRETAHPQTRPNRPNTARADEKRRQRPKDYDMSRSTPAVAPQKPAKVDPNSPFAKLLELRSLLEEKANKRQ
jgi:ATP-dependent RNA helicase SUPV3L1/SUV3